jgi:hypothetical protein
LSLEKRGDFEGSTVLSFCQGLNECKATLYREKKMKKKDRNAHIRGLYNTECCMRL